MRPSMKVYSGEGQKSTRQNIALYQAAKNGNIHELEKAIENGANINFTSRLDEGCPSSILETVKLQSKEGIACTKILLDNGAKMDTILLQNGNTALHEAAHVGSEQTCRLLLENMMDDDANCSSSSSPSLSSKRNSYGNTPLFQAVRSGSVETARLLMEQSSIEDINAVNHLGSTILHLCAFMVKHTESTKSIQNETNASPCANGDEHHVGDGISQSNEEQIIEPHFEIASMLLASGKFTSLDVLDHNGLGPLHIASQRGCIQLVKLLVKHGASLSLKTTIDHKGRGGRTPAGMAKFGGMNKTHDLLVEIMENTLRKKKEEHS